MRKEKKASKHRKTERGRKREVMFNGIKKPFEQMTMQCARFVFFLNIHLNKYHNFRTHRLMHIHTPTNTHTHTPTHRVSGSTLNRVKR